MWVFLLLLFFILHQSLQVVAVYLLRTTHWQIIQLKTKIALHQILMHIPSWMQLQSQDRQVLAHVAKAVTVWPGAHHLFQWATFSYLIHVDILWSKVLNFKPCNLHICSCHPPGTRKIPVRTGTLDFTCLVLGDIWARLFMWDLGEQRLIKSHPSNRIYIFSTLKQIFYVCVFWLLNSITCRHQPRQQRNGKLIITLLEGLKLKTRGCNNSKWDIKDMPFYLSLSLNSGWRDAVKVVLLCLCTLQPSQYVEAIMACFGYYCRFLFNQINRTKPDNMTFGGKVMLLGHVKEHSLPAQSCSEQWVYLQGLCHMNFTR